MGGNELRNLKCLQWNSTICGSRFLEGKVCIKVCNSQSEPDRSIKKLSRSPAVFFGKRIVKGSASGDPALWNIVFITQYANIIYENAQQSHEWSRWSCLVWARLCRYRYRCHRLICWSRVRVGSRSPKPTMNPLSLQTIPNIQMFLKKKQYCIFRASDKEF